MDKLIDNRNSNLWNYVNARHRVEIKFGYGGEYHVCTKGDESIIYVPKGMEDASSFTHELLHVFLHIKSVHIGTALMLSIKGRPQLREIFSDSLLEHIGNCLEHVKMLPEFLKMGFAAKDFLADFSKNKLTDTEIDLLGDHFEKGNVMGQSYSKEYIDLFIGKYFAAACCPNAEIDYSENLNRLRKIDSSLVNELDTFLASWKNFDYNNNDPITGGYRMMVYDFVEGLEKWVEGKLIN